MSDLFPITLNTNVVKLRSPIYKSIRAEVTAGCSAGDLIIPHAAASIVAVACEDITAGTLGSLIYAADKIVVPCDFGSNQKAGASVDYSGTSGKIVEAGAGNVTVGILNVAATTADTECEITLFGFALASEGS
jgi:predicted RecA/RadA family phage recombinase